MMEDSQLECNVQLVVPKEQFIFCQQHGNKSLLNQLMLLHKYPPLSFTRLIYLFFIILLF